MSPPSWALSPSPCPYMLSPLLPDGVIPTGCTRRNP
jgi:hypothetical protein